MRTTVTTRAGDIERQWYVADAAGQILGRFASRLAQILRGKHKPYYTPHLDCGDHIIVINASKVRVSGRKAEQKVYLRHSGYPGGLKVRTYEDMMAKHPERIIEHAVRGMLPHNRLGRKMYRKLKVYAGPDHQHQAQKPETLEL
jgi:large subunit ribosomal protein L13